MSIDDRLRELLNETGAQLDLEPAGAEHIRAMARRRTRRNRIAAATAAVVAFAGVGTAMFQLSGSDDNTDQTAIEAAPEEAGIAESEPLSDPAESTAGGPAGRSQQPVDAAEETFATDAAEGTQLAPPMPVTNAFGDRLVAVTGNQVLLVGADGSETAGAPLPVGDDTFVIDVAASDAEVLVLVAELSGETSLWSTTDLAGWTPVELPLPEFPAADLAVWTPTFGSLAVDGARRLVVGSAFADIEADDETAISPELQEYASNGLGVVLVGPTDGPLLAVTDATIPRLTDVVATGAGFVGYGWDGSGSGIWTSIDGVEWTPSDLSMLDTGVPSAIAHAGRLTILAGSGGTDPIVWWSTDGGTTFASANLSTDLATDDGTWTYSVESLAVSPDGTVAVVVSGFSLQTPVTDGASGAADGAAGDEPGVGGDAEPESGRWLVTGPPDTLTGVETLDPVGPPVTLAFLGEQLVVR